MPPLPNQAVPGPALPNQARPPPRGRPARGSQPADNAKRKGKGRPMNLQAAASCSVLPFLHTLELCFTGTLLCSHCMILWFPAIAGILPPLPRLELCFTGTLLCCIPTLLTLYSVVLPRDCWNPGSSPQIVAVLRRLSTVPRT